MVSYVWSNANFLLFPHWFGALAFKAMAFSEILLIFRSKICRLSQNGQTKFINLIHHHIAYALVVIT